MHKKKAQSNIIAFMLIIGVSLFLVSSTYYWLVPTVKEITSLNDVKKIEKQMLDLHKAISQVSREKSQRSLPLSINRGTIRVREDSIIYSGFYDLPEPEKGEEMILYGGINSTCGAYTCINCSKDKIGKLGSDEPACLLRRGNVEIELRYLRLNDSFTGNMYDIKFKTSQRSHGGPGSRSINIEWVNRTIRENPSQKNTTSYLSVDIY